MPKYTQAVEREFRIILASLTLKEFVDLDAFQVDRIGRFRVKFRNGTSKVVESGLSKSELLEVIGEAKKEEPIHSFKRGYFTLEYYGRKSGGLAQFKLITRLSVDNQSIISDWQRLVSLFQAGIRKAFDQEIPSLELQISTDFQMDKAAGLPVIFVNYIEGSPRLLGRADRIGDLVKNRLRIRVTTRGNKPLEEELIKRTCAHELGHVLGLIHPWNQGQDIDGVVRQYETIEQDEKDNLMAYAQKDLRPWKLEAEQFQIILNHFTSLDFD